MASPSKENGFTGIANELFDAILRFHCSGGQKDVMWGVVRCTYGYGHTEHRLSITYLASKLDREKRKTGKDIAWLMKKNVLIEVAPSLNNKGRTIGFNPDYETWDWGIDGYNGPSVVESDHRCVVENNLTSMGESNHTSLVVSAHQYNKDLKKEIKKDIKQKRSLSSCEQQQHDAAEEIYAHYADTVRAGAKQDAVTSILKLFNDGKTKETLIACIDRYAKEGMSSERGYRIQANNFFGMRERYKEFLEGSPPAREGERKRTGLTETQLYYLRLKGDKVGEFITRRS